MGERLVPYYTNYLYILPQSMLIHGYGNKGSETLYTVIKKNVTLDNDIISILVDYGLDIP